MEYGRLIRTVYHLKVSQVYHQLKNRIDKPRYIDLKISLGEKGSFSIPPIDKAPCLDGDMFTFLNQEHCFSGWNFVGNGMLWAYNQNYFDWINQNGFLMDDGCKWIDKFIAEVAQNEVGLDPYPIALRSINWVKFFCKHPETATIERCNSLYSQIKLLERKLEFHIMGNHLLEDAYALYLCAYYLKDQALIKKAEKLLYRQLKEQILPDGAHFEQSPMYHCILLDRLLDCINIHKTDTLVRYALKMLGHLGSIIWIDGGIPLMNDSANGIAPSASQIFAYAKKLGLSWVKLPMKESGYRKMIAGVFESIVDVGNITATYQPGHTHADTFNYELRIKGLPFIVDTGISTYNKNARRQYERSTSAHNSVVIEGKDSSEVWGGFRVGRRATVSIQSEILNAKSHEIVACHNGYRRQCFRSFKLTETNFSVVDQYDGNGVSYIHLAPNVKVIFAEGKIIKTNVATIVVTGDCRVVLDKELASTQYNSFEEVNVLKLFFLNQIEYRIEI